MSFWQENYAFIKVLLLLLNTVNKEYYISMFQDVYDNRSEKMVEVMDKCDKSISEV